MIDSKPDKYLERQHKTFAIAVEQSPSTIVVTDTSGKIEYVNPKFTQLTGYSAEEAIGQTPRILKTCETRLEVYRDLWKTILSGDVWRGEFCNKKKNGEFYWESASISPVKNSEGTITNFVAVKENITKRKAMEAELNMLNESLEYRVAERTEELEEKNIKLLNEIVKREQAEEKYYKLIHSAYDAIFIADLETGIILEANKSAEKLIGMFAEEIVGMHQTQLHPREDIEHYRHMFEEHILSEKAIEEAFVIHKNGYKVPVSISASVIAYNGKKVIQGVFRDMSEHKRVEGQVKASLKEKEVLLDEIHHRVKNNLQIISSLLDMSSMQTQNQEAVQLLAESRNRVNSIALIHSHLYESERFDEIDMGRHIQELSENLLSIYSKEGIITLDIKCSKIYLPVNLAVPYALVLNELISNSLKYAYKDGQQGVVSVSMQQNGDTIFVRVEDDGIGIPEEIDIEKTNSLGLKLVRNIVNKQLNGRLKVIRDRGTVFVIEFNISKEDS